MPIALGMIRMNIKQESNFLQSKTSKINQDAKNQSNPRKYMEFSIRKNAANKLEASNQSDQSYEETNQVIKKD